MQVGKWEVPEVRLFPNAIEDINLIAKTLKDGEIQTEDLARLLGYKSSHSGGFYRRLNSLISYGLLSGRGKFRVTQLGEDICFPHNDQHLRESYKQAVLSVPLWNELYKKHKKSPSENLWLDIKSITGVTSAEAQTVQREIERWYTEDIALLPDESPAEKQPEVQKDYSSAGTNVTSVMGIQQPVIDLGDEKVVGRIIVRGVGLIDVKNKTTYKIAKSYLELMKEELGIAEENDSTKKDY